MIVLSKAESDAAYAAAMSFIEKEIHDSSLVPSMFSGAAERGLQAHSATVRQLSDLVATAALKASVHMTGAGIAGPNVGSKVPPGAEA